MSTIPLLTLEDLAALRERSEAPGQLARTWTALTREVALRLGNSRPWVRTRRRTYADERHYLHFEMDREGAVAIAFGSFKRDGGCIPVGQLAARWDAVGLTGPYRVLLRGRAYPLATFHAALEPYLSLPAASHRAT